VFVGLVARNDRFRDEPDEDVVRVGERLAETSIPSIAVGTDVASKQPPRPLWIEPLDCRPPAHTDVVDEAALWAEIDDTERAARLACESGRETVVTP
jgi:hypothetical protein